MKDPFARLARLTLRLTQVSVLALTAFLVASCGSDTADTPPQFSTTVVLGSSMADTGNRCGLPNDPDPVCFPAPPYKGSSTAVNASSASNPSGLLYPQLIAARYGAPVVASRAGGLNFAHGGARTGVIPTDTVTHAVPNLQLQLDQAVQRVNTQFIAQTLFVVDAGPAFANNIRRALELAVASPAATNAIIQGTIVQGATDIGTILTRLYALGARHVVLTNVADVGTVPVIRAFGAQAIGAATLMSTNFNGALQAQVLPAVRAASPGLSIYLVDVGQLGAQVIGNPGSFGFTDVAAPCYPFFSAPATPVCTNPDQFLWWDEYHPSAALHALIAQRAAAVMPAP
jgi:outer membrane lipase/esterase